MQEEQMLHRLGFQGTKLSTSALSFVSTVGIAATSQAVAVTAPSGADFAYETDPYVDYTDPDGSTSTLSIREVFSITKTSTGLVVQPTGIWAGHFAGRLYITTPGYAKVPVTLDYQVGDAATTVVTPLTSSGCASC